MKDQNPTNNRKLVIIGLAFVSIFVFMFISYRFIRIMTTETVNGEDLGKMVEMQYTNQNKIPAKRGEIFDRHGESIAVSSISYNLIAILTDEWSPDSSHPNHVVDKEETAKILSQHISMSKEDILAQLEQEGVKQAEFGSVGRNLSYETKNKIENEDLPGIVFEEQPARLYPNGVFASHIVGLAQEDKNQETDDLVGVLGLEAFYQDQLSGQDGAIQYQQDVLGYAIPGQDIGIAEAVDGHDMHLTIDKSIQMYLESIVSRVNHDNPSAAITATLMDAKSGKILAATQRETFNPTTKENIDATWQNYHAEYTFEPGSTFKVITLAASINEGIFDPHAYFQSGQYEYAGEIINDVKPEGWGSISYLEGLARSSNVAFVRLFEEMGSDQWKDYLDIFGYGQKTGISLPNENAGSNPYSNPLQQANTSFGQGLTVTPVQMMQAFSAIANDGKMMKPMLVEKMVNSENGKEKVFEPEVVGQPISEEAADETLRQLSQATQHPESTSVIHQIDGYEIAIKTGTSEMVDPETGRYMQGSNNHIFSVVGFAPAQDPQYIFYVTVQQPELTAEASYGGQVVANIFRPVMKWTLDQNGQGELVENSNIIYEQMPKLSGSSLAEAEESLSQMSQNAIIIGSGNEVVQQYPYAGAAVYPNDTIILMTNGSMTVPDMTGLSKNEVLKISELTGVAIEVEGSGYVSQQSLSPGQALQPGDQLSVQLTEQAPPPSEAIAVDGSSSEQPSINQFNPPSDSSVSMDAPQRREEGAERKEEVDLNSIIE